MENPETHDPQEERANELYWESDDSVNRIAETLSISKGALYGLIQPRSAGIVCPVCGGDLEYSNRTARDRGVVSCPDCGFEDDEVDVSAAEDGTGGDGEADPGYGRRFGALLSRGDRAFVGSALIGLAAGIVIGSFFGGRR